MLAYMYTGDYEDGQLGGNGAAGAVVKRTKRGEYGGLECRDSV
jgi:hypothetical protein